jgi:ankyrin repeat protein
VVSRIFASCASDLHFATQDGDMTRVRQLLADGRSPNAFDELSKTPLHYAAENGHIDIMRVTRESYLKILKAFHRGGSPLF